MRELAASPPCDRPVAVLAVDRLIGPRRERDLRRCAALRAHRVEHHTLPADARAIALARPAALGAAGGLVLEALLGIELLFAGREGEFGAAIATGEVPINKRHVSPQFSLFGKRQNLRQSRLCAAIPQKSSTFVFKKQPKAGGRTRAFTEIAWS